MLSVTQNRNTISPQISGILRAFSSAGINRAATVAANEFIRQTKENFGSNNTYKDTRWPPYSKSYAKVKGKSQADLKVTGNLYDSILKTQAVGGKINVYTKVPYGVYNAYGTRNMPSRQFFPIQSQSITYSRLVFNSERDIRNEISKIFLILSGGALPKLSTSFARMPFRYGNPLTNS